MSITHLLNKGITILRLSSSGVDRMAMLTVTASIAHIQPYTDDKRQLTEGVYGKQFKIFVDGAKDIRQGDRIIDADGNQYTVLADGASRRTFGSIDFRLLLCEKTI